MEKRTFIIKPTEAFTLSVYALTFVIWVIAYYYYPQEEAINISSNSWFGGILSPNSIFTHILTFSLMWVNLILLRRFNEKFGIIRVRTVMPELVYMLLITFWFPLHINYIGQVSLLLILIILGMTFDTYRIKDATENSFIVFFLISLLALILPEWLILIPFFFLFFRLLRSFSVKVFLAGLLGFLPVYSFIFGYHYLVNDKLPNMLGALKEIAYFDWIQVNSRLMIVYVGILLIFLLVSLFQVPFLRLQDNTRQRQYNLTLRLLMLLPIILIVCRTKITLMVLPLLAMIYSFLFSYSLSLRKSLINRVVFYLFVSITILIPFYLMLFR